MAIFKPSILEDEETKVRLLDSSEDHSVGNIWSPKQRYWWIITLWTGALLVYATRMSTPLCAVHMAHDLNWNKQTEGLILSSFFVGYSLSQVIGGLLSDMYGGAIMLSYAGMAWSILIFITPIVVYWHVPLLGANAAIYITRVGSGIFQGFHYPAQTSLMSTSVSQQERAFTYSFVSTGAAVGSVLSGSFGSVILSSFGWPLVFYIFGSVSFLWAVILKQFSTAASKDAEHLVENGCTNHRGSSWNNFKTAAKLQFFSVPWSTLIIHPAFWSLITAAFCDGVATGIAWSWSPTYFHEVFPEGSGWVYNGFPWVVKIFFNLFGGILADNLVRKGVSVTRSRKIMTALSMGGSALFLLMLTGTKSYYPALFHMSFAIGITGFITSGIPIVPQDITPSYAGIIYGILNSAGALASIIGAYLPGLILEYVQSWSVVFCTAAAVNIFGTVVFLMFGSSEKIV